MIDITLSDNSVTLTVENADNFVAKEIKGHGGDGYNGGPKGDLLIHFSIADHPKFERQGNNLFTDVDLNLYTAILGGDIILETLKGQVKINVKPETQNGSKINLKGKGFPVYRKEGVFGDLQVTYYIKIPTHLSEKQVELITALSQT